FAIKHGEAVAVDMALSSRIAVLLGLLDESSYRRIVHLIHALGLPVFSSSTCIPSNAERALRHAYDRRRRRVNLAVPVADGAAARGALRAYPKALAPGSSMPASTSPAAAIPDAATGMCGRTTSSSDTRS